MQKWEYITITFSVEDSKVKEINTKPIRKKAEDEAGNLSISEEYKLHEYLALLGKDGWEVVTAVGKIIIAKRPLA